MNQQGCLRFEPEEQVLPAAMNIHDAAVAEPWLETRLYVPPQPAFLDKSLRNPRANQEGKQRTADGFNFRKFGHEGKGLSAGIQNSESRIQKKNQPKQLPRCGKGAQVLSPNTLEMATNSATESVSGRRRGSMPMRG